VKAFLRSAPMQHLIASLIAGWLKFCHATTRWTREDEDKAQAVWSADSGAILCLWHANGPLGPKCWPPGPGRQEMRCLISLSPDGEAMTLIMNKMGYPAIRGSSQKVTDKAKHKSGEQAFRDMVRWVKSGGAVSITPDGPRGPVEVMQPGAPTLSRVTGAPVILCGLASRPNISVGQLGPHHPAAAVRARRDGLGRSASRPAVTTTSRRWPATGARGCRRSPAGPKPLWTQRAGNETLTAMAHHDHADHHHHHHGHDHGHGHGHAHAPKDFGRAFAIGAGLNIAFVAVEAAAGLMTGSLALVADAGHNLSDVLGLLMAWGAAAMAKQLPTARRTYGLRKGTILASLANAGLLLVAVGAIVWEATRRFAEPHPIQPGLVMVVAIIGVVDQHRHRPDVHARPARSECPRGLPAHGGRCGGVAGRGARGHRHLVRPRLDLDRPGGQPGYRGGDHRRDLGPAARLPGHGPGRRPARHRPGRRAPVAGRASRA
jgi:lysophospholipid acyltransferase (LPLAT)-like uncharacterized protein